MLRRIVFYIDIIHNSNESFVHNHSIIIFIYQTIFYDYSATGITITAIARRVISFSNICYMLLS